MKLQQLTQRYTVYDTPTRRDAIAAVALTQFNMALAVAAGWMLLEWNPTDPLEFFGATLVFFSMSIATEGLKKLAGLEYTEQQIDHPGLPIL